MGWRGRGGGRVGDVADERRRGGARRETGETRERWGGGEAVAAHRVAGGVGWGGWGGGGGGGFGGGGTRAAGRDDADDAREGGGGASMVRDARTVRENVASTANVVAVGVEPAWGSDSDEDSQALLNAVTLVERNAAKSKASSTQNTQRSDERLPSLNDMALDDDDDDLYAAVAMAERARDIRGASGTTSAATSPRLSPRKSTATAAAASEALACGMTPVKREKKEEIIVHDGVHEGVYDEEDADFIRALELELEQARLETEILGTWIVERVESTNQNDVDALTLRKVSGETKKVVLKDDWRISTPVSVGDSVTLYCLDEAARARVREDVVEVTIPGAILLILFPSYLISATVIGGSRQCVRQTVLQQQIHQTWGDANEAATVGTIMHELAERAILSAAGRNPEPMEVTVERTIKASAQAIFEIDYTEKQLKQKIDDTIPGVQTWAHKLAALSRVTKLPRATPGGNPLVRMNRKAAIDKLRNRCTMGVEADGLRGIHGILQVDEVVDIEELIWAPKLGLKGILDGVASAVLRKPGEDLPTPSVVPLELKTGKWRDLSHEAQVALYTLMMGERYGTMSPFGILHYTEGGGEGDSKIVQPTQTDLAYLMCMRNRLAACLRPTPEAAAKQYVPVSAHGKARLGNGTLPKMQPNSWCERCFARDDCFTMHRALEGGNGVTSELGDLFETATSHLNKKYEDTLRHWLHLIDLESSELLRKRATPWLPVELVNQRDTFALDELTFVREITDDLSNGDGLYYYVFRPSPSASESVLKRIAIADRVILSIYGGATTISRAQIRNVSAVHGGVHILMSTERPLRINDPNDKLEPLPGSCELDTLWRIDKDGASLTMAARTRGNMLALFSATELARINRQRIVDLQRPLFAPLGEHKRTMETALKTVSFPLNPEQMSAVEKIITAEDYALVLGYPGAGKTATLVAAITALRAQGKSVLIASHTHSAIDNILSRLPDVGITDFLRVGDEQKIAPAVRPYMLGSERWCCSTSDDIRKISERATIVGATCYAMGHSFFQRKSYDVVLIDESGQITLPNILPPLFMAKTFVLVGDHHQLPPLVVSKKAAAAGLNRSLFAKLCDSYPDIVTHLSLQYRMAEPLTRLPNILTYEGKLTCGTQAIAKQVLSLDTPKGVYASAPDWMKRVMDPTNHFLFLDTSGLGSAALETPTLTTNEAELDLVTTVVNAFVTHGTDPENVCTLSPFNAQVDAMQARLNGYTLLRGVESLTIDRAQGRDMDAICISLVRSNDQRIAGELLNDERRLNVAITRAKKKLVIVGCADTLSSSPVLARAIDFLRRSNWIVPLTPEALDFAKRALAN